MTLTVRPMSADEYDQWQRTIAVDYARQQVSSGRWAAEGAVERALAENAQLLPAGIDTERMLLLRGVADDGTPVGRAWVALDHPRDSPDCAFLYDIEIDEPYRGQGWGKQLLAAVEREVADAGIPQLELNVFGGNTPAISLYTRTGYELVTQQMRKRVVAS